MSPGRAWARAQAVGRLYAAGPARPLAAKEDLAVRQVLQGPKTPAAVLQVHENEGCGRSHLKVYGFVFK